MKGKLISIESGHPHRRRSIYGVCLWKVKDCKRLQRSTSWLLGDYFWLNPKTVEIVNKNSAAFIKTKTILTKCYKNNDMRMNEDMRKVQMYKRHWACIQIFILKQVPKLRILDDLKLETTGINKWASLLSKPTSSSVSSLPLESWIPVGLAYAYQCQCYLGTGYSNNLLFKSMKVATIRSSRAEWNPKNAFLQGRMILSTLKMIIQIYTRDPSE